MSTQLSVRVLGQSLRNFLNNCNFKELQHCRKLKLERPKGVKRSSVYFMSPINLHGDAMLPTVACAQETTSQGTKEACTTAEESTNAGSIDWVVLFAIN
eukprot:4861240-Amphidinium_carterae.2